MEIKDGISRDAHNRSGMLWEVERILKERVANNSTLPKFLLMENVSAILSSKHRANFEEWLDFLKDIGYMNQIYTLNASDFGIPQKRVRTYMISILTNHDVIKENAIKEYFATHNLQDREYAKTTVVNEKKKNLATDILKLDYDKEQYRLEANACQPNDTKSRRDIYVKNEILCKDGHVEKDKIVPTVTTKQDRHPNSGLIDYARQERTKSDYRYLTPRECFLLMGFEENDYQNIIDNNFVSGTNEMFFTRDKLYKMAGNSIVVNVLEEVFKQIMYINDNILTNDNIVLKDFWEDTAGQLKMGNVIL